MPAFDAVVLAESELARVRIAGLSAAERAERVARRVGAERVAIVRTPADRAALASEGGDRALLVIAADQLVHPPLVAPLVAARGRVAIAVAPDARGDDVAPDLDPGAYAGALWATGDAVHAIRDQLARGTSDREIAATFADADRVAHGPIARAPIATAEQRRAAHRLLYRILVKPQDNAITRYLYRPISFPLTRLLVWTPITPNQISYAVAVLVAIGCWITARGSWNAAIAGTAIVLAASYLDCCDGEIARVKLMSSRFGAWIDTVVDELSSVGYMVALGYHCDQVFGPRYFGALPFDPWHAAIALTLVTFCCSIYCIYYNIIVAVGSANSQDYVGRFEVVPSEHEGRVRLAPASPAKEVAPRELPPVLAAIVGFLPNIVRRDFISWAAMILAVLHWTHVAFGGLVLGGVVTVAIVAIDHVKLRALRRSVARDGLILDRVR